MAARRPQRVLEIDQLRAIAITGVVFVHVASGFTSRGRVGVGVLYVDMFMDTLAHYCVPLFILVSGFSLALGWYDRLDVRAFYARRLARTIPPYVVFSLLYSIRPLVRGEITARHVLLNLLTGRAEYHLYFFVVIIPLYLLYPLLVRLHRRTVGCTGRVLLGLALVQTLWWMLSLAVSDLDSLTLAGFTLQGGALGLLQFAIKRAFVMYLFYFYLGLCCARDWDRLKPRLLAWSKAGWRPVGLGVVIVLLITYLFLVRFEFLQPAPWLAFALQSLAELIIYTASLYLLFLLADLLTVKPSVWSAVGLQLSRLSMGIYLVHVAVQRWVDWALGALHLVPATLVAYRYALLITLPLTALIVQALSYLPWAQYWLGVAPAKLSFRPSGGAPAGEAHG